MQEEPSNFEKRKAEVTLLPLHLQPRISDSFENYISLANELQNKVLKVSELQGDANVYLEFLVRGLERFIQEKASKMERMVLDLKEKRKEFKNTRNALRARIRTLKTMCKEDASDRKRQMMHSAIAYAESKINMRVMASENTEGLIEESQKLLEDMERLPSYVDNLLSVGEVVSALGENLASIKKDNAYNRVADSFIQQVAKKLELNPMEDVEGFAKAKVKELQSYKDLSEEQTSKITERLEELFGGDELSDDDFSFSAEASVRMSYENENSMRFCRENSTEITEDCREPECPSRKLKRKRSLEQPTPKKRQSHWASTPIVTRSHSKRVNLMAMENNDRAITQKPIVNTLKPENLKEELSYGNEKGLQRHQSFKGSESEKKANALKVKERFSIAMGEEKRREREREVVLFEKAMTRRKQIIERRLKAQSYGNNKSKRNMKRRSYGGRVDEESMKENSCINKSRRSLGDVPAKMRTRRSLGDVPAKMRTRRSVGDKLTK